MLTISRRPGEELAIGPDIRVVVKRVVGHKVVLGIAAPREVAICRIPKLPLTKNAKPS